MNQVLPVVRYLIVCDDVVSAAQFLRRTEGDQSNAQGDALLAGRRMLGDLRSR